MFVAIDENWNNKIAIESQKSEAPFYCPECGELVILNQGRVKVPHFKHKQKNWCEYGEGESPEHLYTKMWVYKYFSAHNILAEPECRRWQGVRPDVAVALPQNSQQQIISEIQEWFQKYYDVNSDTYPTSIDSPSNNKYQWIAFEIQKSHISISEIERRNNGCYMDFATFKLQKNTSRGFSINRTKYIFKKTLL